MQLKPKESEEQSGSLTRRIRTRLFVVSTSQGQTGIAFTRVLIAEIFVLFK